MKPELSAHDTKSVPETESGKEGIFLDELAESGAERNVFLPKFKGEALYGLNSSGLYWKISDREKIGKDDRLFRIPLPAIHPGYVYMAAEASRQGFVKIGMSKNWRERMKSLDAALHTATPDGRWKTLALWRCEDMRAFEKALHLLLAPWKVRGEWFDRDRIQPFLGTLFAPSFQVTRPGINGEEITVFLSPIASPCRIFMSAGIRKFWESSAVLLFEKYERDGNYELLEAELDSLGADSGAENRIFAEMSGITGCGGPDPKAEPSVRRRNAPGEVFGLPESMAQSVVLNGCSWCVPGMEHVGGGISWSDVCRMGENSQE